MVVPVTQKGYFELADYLHYDFRLMAVIQYSTNFEQHSQLAVIGQMQLNLKIN